MGDQRSHDYSNKFKASIKEAKDVVNKKNNEIEVEKANTMSYNASHSYSLAERRAFSSWINQHLSTDPDCKDHIPIDVDTEKLFNSLEDGIVLCKAINCAKPNTIDERVLNKKNLNIFKKRENLILGLNSALSLGCKIVNIRPEDLSAGVPHLILGLLWQIIRHALLKNISLSKNVDIMSLLKPGESIADLENMTPENILMRWVNHHLSRGEKGGALIWDGNHNALSSNTSGDFVSNFGNDLSNSVAYINLINQIGGKDFSKLGAKAIKIKDNLERAGAMLKMAEKIGVKPIITANDVVHGDEKLNMAFLATLFNSHNALDKNDLDEEILEQLDIQDLENALEEIEESREEETFRNWVNSLDVKPISKSMSSNVNHLYNDLRDGLYLLKIEDEVKPGVVNWSRVHKSYDRWQKHMKCMENCSYAVQLAQDKLKYSLVGINGANIYEMDRTRTLAKGGKSSRVNNFKEKDLALAVIDICDILSPGSVDYSLVHQGDDKWLSPENRLDNALLAINLSRKIGAKIYASPMDLVEGKLKMILTIFVGLMSKSFENGNQNGAIHDLNEPFPPIPAQFR